MGSSSTSNTRMAEVFGTSDLGAGAAASTAEVDQAVAAARAALPGWRSTPAPERAALLRAMDEGYDMVVGARANAGQASMSRLFANSVYNRFATLVVGHHIEDLTSGFRAVRREKFLEFLYLLPNGFSYPTTITIQN